MRGMFGVVLPPDSTVDPWTDLTVLGLLAEERGVHAAGLATFHHKSGWSTNRTTGPFTRLVHRATYPALIDRFQVAIGHTRAAPQGGRSLGQAPPLAVAGLLGTHNGDLNPDSIPHALGRRDLDTTDSQLLFAALATGHRGRRLRLNRILTVLSNARGRPALAWTDTRRADGHVWLASAAAPHPRCSSTTALSGGPPRGCAGSDPTTTPRLLHRHRLGPHLPTQPRQPAAPSELQAHRAPLRRTDGRRLRGFSPAERVDDHTQLRHRVHPAGRLA